jgi:hypothetical protein
MVRLVANWITASGKLRNLHAGGALGKFVGLFPLTDFRSLESQLFMTQNMEFDSPGTLHFLDASVHIQ